MEHTYSKADLHLHTTASDGTASVAQLLAHIARTDLRVISITDHDTIAGAREAQRLAGEFGVEVIVGEEVSTRERHLPASPVAGSSSRPSRTGPAHPQSAG